MNPIKVAIADDEDFVRAALREYLSVSPEFHVVGEAADGEEALELVRSTAADVLLLDISMPRVSGLEVLRRIRSVAPLLPVVVLSAYAPETYEQEGWSAAGACLDKACGPDEVLRTVRRVALARREPAAAELS